MSNPAKNKLLPGEKAVALGLTSFHSQTQEEITWQLLGGKHFLKQKPLTLLDLFEAVRRGVPKRSVDLLADVMMLPMTSMAPLLNLSYKTLIRKQQTELLDAVVSSHTYEMATTIAKGLELFGSDEEKLNRWLRKENRALKGHKPIDLLGTPTGIKLVNQLLGRIEEGVYS